MTRIASDRLAEVLVEVADTLVDEFDLIDFLQRVTTHASTLVSARICGLMLADHRGRLRLMAASDERAEMLELFQSQVDEGPCLDCYRTGAPVIVTDLHEATERWPRFAPHSVGAGFSSIHAFPMRLRGDVIGTLNMFGVRPGAMDASDVRVVQALADIATIALMQERAISRGEVLTEQLQSALNSRIVVEQAKGFLAQLHHESPDEAFTRMRAIAEGAASPWARWPSPSPATPPAFRSSPGPDFAVPLSLAPSEWSTGTSNPRPGSTC